MSLLLVVLVAAPLLIVLWGVMTYNNLVRLKAMLDEAWSGVDVQLKRRADLIPNIVSTVKGYSIHEKNVLENITKFRAESAGAKNVAEKNRSEAALTGALKSLFVVVENYPELKANENFLSLQSDLSSIEQELQLARRYFNGTVRNYNIVVDAFPSKFVAHMTGFQRAVYFQVEDVQERNVPKVDF
jgi:LemA protein